MGVIVVKARAIAEHQVAFDLMKSEGALGILGEVIGLVGVLQELFDPETTRVAMRVFATVVPAHAHAGSGGAANQGDGFGYDIEPFRFFAADPDLGLYAKLNVHTTTR